MRYRNSTHKTSKPILILSAAAGIILTACAISAVIYFCSDRGRETPQELLAEYMKHIPEKEYGKMYAMLDKETARDISEEEFITRNSAIYEGIGTKDMVVKVTEYDEGKRTVKYHASFDTVAGKISFDNEATFVKEGDGYRLVWEDSLIFPGLEADDKIKVSVTQAERGQILDRNDRVLAGKGTASSVGIVPGKLEDRERSVEEIAELLALEPEVVEKKLDAQWVKEDSFVPVKTVAKVSELDLLAVDPGDEAAVEARRQEKLLAIPGVMITDVEVREYPLKEAAAHLTGYVQSVTAEDLKEHAGEGYASNSVIGRSGIEGLYEKELKGNDGYSINMMDSDGNLKKVLANVMVEDGQDIKLTVDAELQSALYEQFAEDKSCSVAMNPYTGEVLALVSTPSYDSNGFITGMTDEEWTALNEDEKKPLYNRFRQVWSPGSTFKPVTAFIGLDSGAIDPEEDFGNEGLSWQKDASWGSYHVTTLHEYSPAVLENALIYSDNIYFAKAALKIGAEELQEFLQKIGFGKELPFEISMSVSQYSNTEKIETEIQLADSGYGQGQVLVNPLHLAGIYTSFCNDGNMIKPYLRYEEEPKKEIWIQGACTPETAGRVLEGMKKVVNDSNGTGYAAHREDIILAGKTGTAEIKDSKEDTAGTELGWFAVLTPDKEYDRPILVVSMVEDVKDIGGSGYVVGKDKDVLDAYLTH